MKKSFGSSVTRVRILAIVVLTVLFACKGHEREVRPYKWKLVPAPADAREIRPDTFVRTAEMTNRGPSIETLPEFGYSETINPTDHANAVTSLEVGTFASLPPNMRMVFAGARIGETRQVWSCAGRSRANCEMSEYTFYLPPR